MRLPSADFESLPSISETIQVIEFPRFHFCRRVWFVVVCDGLFRSIRHTKGTLTCLPLGTILRLQSQAAHLKKNSCHHLHHRHIVVDELGFKLSPCGEASYGPKSAALFGLLCFPGEKL